jgi:hypothetical protein
MSWDMASSMENNRGGTERPTGKFRPSARGDAIGCVVMISPIQDNFSPPSLPEPAISGRFTPGT